MKPPNCNFAKIQAFVSNHKSGPRLKCHAQCHPVSVDFNFSVIMTAWGLEDHERNRCGWLSMLSNSQGSIVTAYKHLKVGNIAKEASKNCF
jgi:hypothetical protein